MAVHLWVPYLCELYEFPSIPSFAELGLCPLSVHKGKWSCGWVTAFVSYSACRWWWKRRLRSAWRHTLDWTSKICAVHAGTHTCILHILPWAEDIKPRPWESVHHCGVRKNWRLTWESQSRYWRMKVHEDPPLPPATTCFLNHLLMHHLDTRRPQGCKHRGVNRKVAVAPPIAVKEPSRVHLLPRSCKLVLMKGFMSGYLHSCVRPCLQSADSCSNTIKDDVICIITSVNARECAYRSRADSNAAWSWRLILLPFRYGSVCKRQRNVPQHFQHFQNKTLVFLLLVCQPRIQQPIFRPADAFLYMRGAHLVSCVWGCVYCGRDGVVAARWQCPSGQTQPPKGNIFIYLFFWTRHLV